MKHRFIAKKYWNEICTPMTESAFLGKEYPDLINFSIGDPDFTTDERIINAAFTDAKNGHTHYTDLFGDPELREEICMYHHDVYHFQVGLDECLVTTSGSQAMFLALEAILDEGDEVIVPEPCFTPYPYQIRISGGKPVVLPTLEEDGFQPDMGRLKSLLTNRTKAMIINTPNNPTGVCYSRETLERIAQVAMDHDLMIIADDIYPLFSYAEPHVPVATLEGMRERTITIRSFSKDYAMTGWRVGYTLAPPFLTKMMEEINENNVFTAPSISQRAALHGLRMRNLVQPPLVEEYQKRSYYAYERIKNIPRMSVLFPQGSIYLFVNIKKTGLNSREVTTKLLHEAHVLVLPGYAFGASGEGYVRIALSVGLDKMGEAFDRISLMDIFSH
ncbi:pyridoxal phosphate-dependent aminotransferase [Candidatus Formimonas warabiya]|nr:pyridoxal phosphate-dependent aminotransferase [Candidatus Formimonas warabiya]